MKAAVALLLLAVVVFVQADITDEQKKKLQTHHKECAAESKVNPELIEKARKGDFVVDDKLSKHLFCVAKKIGFINAAGDFQNDVLKTKVGGVLANPELAAKLIEKCAVKKATPEETTYATVKCYYENAHVSIV